MDYLNFNWSDFLELSGFDWKKIIGWSILIRFVIFVLIVFKNPSQSNFEEFLFFIVNSSIPTKIKFLIFLAEQGFLVFVVGFFYILHKNK